MQGAKWRGFAVPTPRHFPSCNPSSSASLVVYTAGYQRLRTLRGFNCIQLALMPFVYVCCVNPCAVSIVIHVCDFLLFLVIKCYLNIIFGIGRLHNLWRFDRSISQLRRCMPLPFSLPPFLSQRSSNSWIDSLPKTHPEETAHLDKTCVNVHALIEAIKMWWFPGTCQVQDACGSSCASSCLYRHATFVGW